MDRRFFFVLRKVVTRIDRLHRKRQPASAFNEDYSSYLGLPRHASCGLSQITLVVESSIAEDRVVFLAHDDIQRAFKVGLCRTSRVGRWGQ